MKPVRAIGSEAEPKVNVAFIAFQSGKGANGGVASLTEIVTNLRTVRPVMITQRETAQTQRWRDAGLEVYVHDLSDALPAAGETLDVWRRGRRLARLLMNGVKLVRIFRTQRVQVVHCNDPAALIAGYVAAKLLAIPIVLNIRDTKGVRGRKWDLLSRAADRIAVLSNEMRTHLEVEVPRIDPASIEVIYSIVDPSRFHRRTLEESSRIRAQLGIPDAVTALGVVAAVCEKKGQLELIRFLAAKKDDGDASWRLYLVGDFKPEEDEYCAACLRAVRDAKLEGQVVFCGFQREIENWYAALDVSVLVSSDEGLARAMIESISCGTPVVSFGVCSASEILTGYACGIVVPIGEFGALWAAAQTLVRDAARRDAMADAGARCAELLFSAENNVAAYEAVYSSLARPAS